MPSKESCLQAKTGSCGGCNIIEIAVLGARWRGKTLPEMQQYIQDEYCPPNCQPEPLDKHINTEACYALGQHRAENTEFTHQRTPLRPKPSKGLPRRKISKSSTGRFFV